MIRIKLYYGEEYGVGIESELSKGTRIILTIPCEPFKDLPEQ